LRFGLDGDRGAEGLREIFLQSHSIGSGARWWRDVRRSCFVRAALPIAMRGVRSVSPRRLATLCDALPRDVLRGRREREQRSARWPMSKLAGEQILLHRLRQLDAGATDW
jgi:hypothetical protein